MQLQSEVAILAYMASQGEQPDAHRADVNADASDDSKASLADSGAISPPRIITAGNSSTPPNAHTDE